MNEEKVWEAFGLMMEMYENKVFSELDRQQATEAGLRDFRRLLKNRLLDRNRGLPTVCLLYTSPSPRDGLLSRMPSSA